MSAIHITKEIGEGAGQYLARVDGIDGQARITFTILGADLISADHTIAPESLRGTGAAAALVAFMVADARENRFRIVPVCPYVQAQYKRHPEWQDVMSVAPGVDPTA